MAINELKLVLNASLTNIFKAESDVITSFFNLVIFSWSSDVICKIQSSLKKSLRLEM